MKLVEAVAGIGQAEADLLADRADIGEFLLAPLEDARSELGDLAERFGDLRHLARDLGDLLVGDLLLPADHLADVLGRGDVLVEGVQDIGDARVVLRGLDARAERTAEGLERLVMRQRLGRARIGAAHPRRGRSQAR